MKDAVSVLLPTCDRLPQLRRAVDSILGGTRRPVRLHVIDAGSTDGTQEYLLAHPGVIAVLQGRKLGPAASMNLAWQDVDTPYSCWLSDDTELVPGALDAALDALEHDPDMGMVGLKTRDTLGPWVEEPYIGGLSEYGIINVNHGVLRTSLARALGGFCEDYRFYFIDPDLTARVLCAGYAVALTRRVAVLHHRAWAEHSSPEERARQLAQGVDNAAIYRRRFRFLAQAAPLRRRIGQGLARLVLPAYARVPLDRALCGLTRRDAHNTLNSRFVSLLDPLRSLGKTCHLVQRLPQDVLVHPDNPCRHLAATERA